jgi:hypothetical protein
MYTAHRSALLDSPPAIPTEVLMRRIGLAVLLALSLFPAPLNVDAQQMHRQAPKWSFGFASDLP